MIALLLVFLLGTSGIEIHQPPRSGSLVMSPTKKEVTRIRHPSPSPYPDSLEIIENGGFEDGILAPWQSQGSYWFVTTTDPHQGQYCASDTGNHWIRQDFSPLLTDSIISITFWARQPEQAIMAFDFIFDDSTYFEHAVLPLSNWTQFDVTSYLPQGKVMVALRLWGYVGAGPDPDITYIDDISILANVPIAVSENTQKGEEVTFEVYPNPALKEVNMNIFLPSNERAALVIFDSKGSLVKKINLRGESLLLETPKFTPGVYFFGLESSRKILSLKRVIILGQ